MHLIMKHDIQEGRAMAWHGLTKVNPELTLANCHLNNWDYVAQRVTLATGEKLPFCVLGVSDGAMVRDTDDNGKEIGDEYPLIIGESYSPASFKPITNAKLIELLTKGTEGKDLVLASCGTVKNRGRQFFSFEMGESYKAGGREFVPFFNVGNGNDKSSPIWQNVSNTCTVCNNTFQMNMGSAGLIMEVKKTKFSELVLGDFSKAMKAMLAGQKEFAGMFDKLALLAVTEDQARAFFAGFIGKVNTPLTTQGKNNLESLVKLFKSGKGNAGENFADIFSAITDYFTHESASGKADDSAKWKNFVSSEFGNGKQQKQRAWMMINTDKLRDATRKIGDDILKRTADADKAANAAP